MKKIIRLSESELKKIVKESVSNILEDDIGTGDSPTKYFYEVSRLKGGEYQNQWESICQSKLLYNTPEEAREAGTRYVKSQPFPCKGIVLRRELGKGGYPLGDEWTFYGGEYDSPIKYFYEVYRLKGGEYHHQSKLLYNTPEEAREAGTRYAEKQPFPCKGIVLKWELGKGGCPLGDESEYDEWTFYGGDDDYEPVYDYKRSEM